LQALPSLRDWVPATGPNDMTNLMILMVFDPNDDESDDFDDV
jgi:hypothetical protein